MSMRGERGDHARRRLPHLGRLRLTIEPLAMIP
jgi:hypothetical protein